MKDVRLLIVDDEEDLRDVLSHQLQDVAGKIELAANGRKALELLKSGNFDAVLSDINMPEMNGLELLARVREMGLDVPFVILTGFGDKAKAVEALRLGAFDFLEKPWQAENVRKAVTEALDYGRRIREIEFELDLAVSDLKGISADRVQKIRAARKALGKMRLNKSTFKRAG